MLNVIKKTLTFVVCRSQPAAVLLTALILPPAAARANPLDRHTLSEEASRFPNLVRVITGRIERNPPLYYEVRLGRLAGELRSFPGDLRKYDDAAVAYHRIKRDDEAIQYMERKRAVLERANPADRAVREHWLRYYENVGAFWAHRWLRAGADRNRIDEIRCARGYVLQAQKMGADERIGLRYLLEILDWIIAPRSKSKNESQTLGAYLGDSDVDARIVGLARLVLADDAWERVDVFEALAAVLDRSGRAALGYLAKLRCAELIDAGRGSVIPGAPTGRDLKRFLRLDVAPLLVADRDEISDQFHALRNEAETFRRERDTHFIERLKSGIDPDTDIMFWRNFSNAPPPSLDLPWPKYVAHKLRGETLLISVIFGSAAILLIIASLAVVRAVATFKKRKRELRTPPAI